VMPENPHQRLKELWSFLRRNRYWMWTDEMEHFYTNI
jgi:hypothetical protein